MLLYCYYSTELGKESSGNTVVPRPCDVTLSTARFMAELVGSSAQTEQAALAASLIRDFVAQGHMSAAVARRAFVAFLIASARGTVSDVDVRTLTVACALRAGCTAIEKLCAACSAKMQDVNEAELSLPLPARTQQDEPERTYDAMLASGEINSDMRNVLKDSCVAAAQTHFEVSVPSPRNPAETLHSDRSYTRASGSRSFRSYQTSNGSPLKRSRTAPKPSEPCTPPKKKRLATSFMSPVPDPVTPQLPIQSPSSSGILDGRFIKFVSTTGQNADVLSTPSKVNRENVNPLDALALVASSTPRSYARSAQGGILPDDPIVQDWISQLTVSKGKCDGFFRTHKLSALIPDLEWCNVSERVRSLLENYTSSSNGLVLCNDKQTQVICVYFSSLEAILEAERTRGSKTEDRGLRFVQKLIRSEEFHACLLSCSLETVAAVHGLRDMCTINSTLKVFGITAYALTKGISSFARQLPGCPKSIMKHLFICEQRYIESVVWRRDSDLVAYLEDRTSSSNTSSLISVTGDTDRHESRASNTSSTMDNGDTESVNQVLSKQTHKHGEAQQAVASHSIGKPCNAENHLQQSIIGEKRIRGKLCSKVHIAQFDTDKLSESKPKEKADLSSSSPCVRELTLKLFYNKLLYIAEERMAELLSYLELDFLDEYVFTIIKHVVVIKWQLLVDRHLDQIILCAIYGVAKVRQHPELFRSIISHYQQLTHLREPTFTTFVPELYTNIQLKHNMKHATQLPPRTGSDVVIRGDIIKMYNVEFMPVMRDLLLRMDPARRDKTSVSTGTPRMKSGAASSSDSASLADSSSLGTSTKLDGLAASVIMSPLRRVRRYASPRRIGNVTVSPMSLNTRPAVSSLVSPVRTAMTPNTRLLYAFRESPGQRPLAGPRRVPATLSFTQPGERPASIRRMYAEAFSQRSRSENSARHPNVK